MSSFWPQQQKSVTFVGNLLDSWLFHSFQTTSEEKEVHDFMHSVNSDTHPVLFQLACTAKEIQTSLSDSVGQNVNVFRFTHLWLSMSLLLSLNFCVSVCVCVCVRACVRVCVRARVCVCVRARVRMRAWVVWRYGMHESFLYYQNCIHRERNKGLFTADQVS